MSNAGDLHSCLPTKLLHDGPYLRQTPLRLSLFIGAPQSMLNAVIEQHALVRQLVDGQWLHLFQLDATSAAKRIARYQQGQWVAESG